jgi:hypothetical protein
MQWTLLHHCLLFHGNAEKFFAAFPIYPTMVFVDGDHRYEGVLRDTGILSRRLKKDTPVLFHDYTNAENDDGRLGVRKAVEEWVQAGRARFAGVCGCSALVVTTRDGEETQPESVVR